MASLKQLYYNYFIHNCVMCVICIKNNINCVLYKCCRRTIVSKTSAGRSDCTLEVALRKKKKKEKINNNFMFYFLSSTRLDVGRGAGVGVPG